MKQFKLDFKQEKFKWMVFLCVIPEQEELIVKCDVEAYTEKQAIWLAAKLIKVQYDEERSFAKKMEKPKSSPENDGELPSSLLSLVGFF
jgi:hypothetical protein